MISSKVFLIFIFSLLINFSFCDFEQQMLQTESSGNSNPTIEVSNDEIIKSMERKRLEHEISESYILGPWASALIATFLISILPIFIIFLVPCLSDENNSKKQTLKILVSFAIGGLLGDVFLHLLPHSLPGEHHDAKHIEGSHSENIESSSSSFLVGIYVLLGMLVFFIIEKYTRIVANSSHLHSHGFVVETTTNLNSSSTLEGGKHKKDDLSNNEKPFIGTSLCSIKIAGLLNIIADATHNFTDGMAIAASFLVSHQVGISTTIAVLFHEIPHEIGDYAILIQSGMSTRQAMMMQFITAIGAFLGTFFGFLTGSGNSFNWVLPFTGGGFIYLATVNVIPELLETTSVRQSIKEVSAVISGGLLMAFLSKFE